MKRYALILISLFLLAGSLSLMRQEAVRSQTETVNQVSPANPTGVSSSPLPTAAIQSQFSGGGGGAAPTATPTPFSANPFDYTPLPVNRGGPENDISQSAPLTASRGSAQVDDFITFTAGIKNIAPYQKNIQSLCFESSDGNFGCVWGIILQPGQSYGLQNVGSWTSGGQKKVWITWSQDGQNYYRPTGSSSVTVTIIN